jgi:glycerophosphoryl diester phosphodiesterase
MTLVVGHRGSPAQRPENTMPSFDLAVEQGVDAIELDVHLTADGQLAVIHDATLERTTDVNGSVAGMAMDSIRAADAGYRFGPDQDTHPYRGQGLRVPTLPEILDWLPEGIAVVVELKAREAADATVAALHESSVGKAGMATVISFDEQSIDRVRELDESLSTGLLLVPFDKIERVTTWAVEHRHQGVYPWDGDLGLDPMPLIAEATAFGLRLGCYVVNEPARMQHLAATGLWGFVTDVPDVARAALSRAGSSD